MYCRRGDTALVHTHLECAWGAGRGRRQTGRRDAPDGGRRYFERRGACVLKFAAPSPRSAQWAELTGGHSPHDGSLVYHRGGDGGVSGRQGRREARGTNTFRSINGGMDNERLKELTRSGVSGEQGRRKDQGTNTFRSIRAVGTLRGSRTNTFDKTLACHSPQLGLRPLAPYPFQHYR